jgi:hypothetical protein
MHAWEISIGRRRLLEIGRRRVFRELYNKKREPSI